MNKHEAVIKRDVYRKIYYYGSYWWYYGGTGISEDKELIETEYLWEGSLDSPVLSIGDEIYISEEDETVIIRKIVRTTHNEYIYYAEDKVISDEVTDESYNKAREEKDKKLQEMKEEAEKEQKQKEEESESVKNDLNWFQSLFKRKNIG